MSTIYRTSLTINHTLCGATDSDNMPVLISASAPVLKNTTYGGRVAGIDGFDILFYADEALTTLLSWELINYNASTGALAARVLIPVVSCSMDTVFYMTYGDDTVTSFQGGSPGAAYIGNYVAFYHLSPGNFLGDSTVSANNLTNSGATQASGIIPGCGAQFGGAQAMSVASPAGLPGGPEKRTMSLWFRMSASGIQAIFGYGNPGTGKSCFFWYDGANLSVAFGGGTQIQFPWSYDGAWHKLTFTYTGGGVLSAINTAIYLDGISQPFTVPGHGIIPETVNVNLTLAAEPTLGTDFFTGAIGEAYIANQPISANWELTTFLNEAGPGNIGAPGFISYGIAVALSDPYPTLVFPCSVNSVPFYPATSDRRSLDAFPNIGHAPYLDTLLQFQARIPYLCKRLFSDYITLQFKTQANSDLALIPAPPHSAQWQYANPAQLYVCSSVIGAGGAPAPGPILSAFTPFLNTPAVSSFTYNITPGSRFWGIQQVPYDVYTDPISGASTPLVSYMWQFTFADVLDPVTDSGIYFLRFDDLDNLGNITTWYSEPILVFGTDAQTTFPTTLEFESANKINKSDILVDGWFNNPSTMVVMTNRVEADILGYEPKGVFMGYLQQNWQAANTYMNSWQTWELKVGSQTTGIPISVMMQIVKLLEMDMVLINNKFYTYDTTGGASTSPSAAWKIEKNRTKGMVRGTLPIREKFIQEFYNSNPIALPRIFSSVFDSTFA